MPIKLQKATLFASLTLSFPFTGSVFASDWISFGEETFELSGGVFLQYFDTDVAVEDQGLGLGAEINLENQLNYDEDDTTGQFVATWRFADRHRVSLGYFDSERGVTAVALDDIDLGGGEFIPAGAGYDSNFDIDTIPFAYTYSFEKSGGSELYGTLGFHWMSIDYEITGALGLGDNEWEGFIDAEAEAPMPLIGLGYDLYLKDRWKVTAAGEVFYINLSEQTFSFEGSVFSLKLASEYYIWNNLAVGAAINYFLLDVDVDDDDWKGSLDYSYWGPSAFIKARF